MEILQKIRNGLEFLVSQKSQYIFKKSDGVFSVDENAHIGHPEGVLTQDSYSYTLDFNKNIITWYSSLESHHNGDPYNSQKGTLPIATAASLLPKIVAKIKQVLLEIEKENEIKKIEDKFQIIANKICEGK